MAVFPETVKASHIDRLTETCRELLSQIALAPSVTVRDIAIDSISSPRFDSSTPKTCYIVTIETNDATLLRGAVNQYKGNYKERIEAVLDHLVKQVEPECSVHVDISGPAIQPIDRLIPIRSFIESKKLSSASPIVKTAKRNQIPYIQIRGRHLIAPSPAIEALLEHYLSRAPRIRRAADFFAGTGIATKVLLRVAEPERIVLIDNDPQKIRRIQEHVRDERVEVMLADASQFSFCEPYDLAVADPYYEDVELFLDAQLDNLRRLVRTLLLVPGNVEDRVWNRGVLARLESVNYEVAVHELYGQVIFEANAKKS